MITFEEALQIVVDSVHPVGSERVELKDASGRVLAEDVKSDIDMPPFSRSSMDGYACRREDLENELKVIETIPAGTVPEKPVGPNECSKIMTGSMVPSGADCVVMVEFTEKVGEDAIRFTGKKTTNNIRHKAEDIKKGEVALRMGTLLMPQHIAVLASVGHLQPLVAKRPGVGIISTGDELVEPQLRPGPSQIRNSNSLQLFVQLSDMGADVRDYGIAKDTVGEIDSLIKKAAGENDIVIVCGGVSVGDFDFVPEVFRQNNFDLLFEKVAVKPGKPTVFGLSEKVFCFGVPGNPVSSFVIFNLLIKPFVYKLMGYDYRPRDIRMPLAESVSRKNTKRKSWIPVVITENFSAVPVEYHGSAHIDSLCGADGLINFEIGAAEIEKDTVVTVRLI
ncbi:MAG TPA: molybdopterin molybdotransferase MoeA [Planctomycetes bacterium]|nr:molybdopterin molybdotransferase MoeA [Planctomycetota bacterium]HIJ72167.1 molybdopterin molybdotransferase MoeA [Planctomycetota bacterium]